MGRPIETVLEPEQIVKREETVTVQRPVYMKRVEREERFVVRRPVVQRLRARNRTSFAARCMKRPSARSGLSCSPGLRNSQARRARDRAPGGGRAGRAVANLHRADAGHDVSARRQWVRHVSAVPQVAYMPQQVVRRMPIETVRYVDEQQVRRVPIQTLRYVEQQEVRQGAVPNAALRRRAPVTRKVPVETVTYVEEQVVAKVPTVVCRFETRQEVRRVPVVATCVEYASWAAFLRSLTLPTRRRESSAQPPHVGEPTPAPTLQDNGQPQPRAAGRPTSARGKSRADAREAQASGRKKQ